MRCLRKVFSECPLFSFGAYFACEAKCDEGHQIGELPYLTLYVIPRGEKREEEPLAADLHFVSFKKQKKGSKKRFKRLNKKAIDRNNVNKKNRRLSYVIHFGKLDFSMIHLCLTLLHYGTSHNRLGLDTV